MGGRSCPQSQLVAAGSTFSGHAPASAHTRESRVLTLCARGRCAMNVMLDFCVVPIGVGVSVSEYVAECQRVLARRGLPHQMHPYGTVVEGEWDAVFAALRECHERVHELGAPRISTSIALGTRPDREQPMAEKMQSGEWKLAGKP